MVKDEPIRWRWALYGLLVGVAVCIVTLVLEEWTPGFAFWLRTAIVRSAGFAGTLLIFGAIGFVAGLVREAVSS
jgi:hypothetical protein